MQPIPRLKKRQDFVAAARYQRYSVKDLTIESKLRSSDNDSVVGPRIGFTVTKKAGKAVIRNRIKRRLRAAVTKIPYEFHRNRDYVIVGRTACAYLPFDELKSRLQFALERVTQAPKVKHNRKSRKYSGQHTGHGFAQSP